MISVPSQQTPFTIRSIRLPLMAIMLGSFVAIKSTAVAACGRMAALLPERPAASDSVSTTR
jgi:hypothetical protein